MNLSKELVQQIIDAHMSVTTKRLEDGTGWSFELYGSEGAAECIAKLADDTWLPIGTAPKDGRRPLLIIGRYPTNTGWSDIYQSWWNGSGWARWPHSFEPTHWATFSTPTERSSSPYAAADGRRDTQENPEISEA